MKVARLVLLLTLPSLLPLTGWAGEVWITPELESIAVTHEGRKVVVQRNQNRDNKVNPLYAFTSRKCPPFCVQPIEAAPGVGTVGELEVLRYLQRMARGDNSVLLIDSRTAQWPERGMIPGAVNIPWTRIDPDHAESKAIGGIFYEDFGAAYQNGRWDYGPAKTLVLYCNGLWCSQSTRFIQVLLGYGYPAEKIKWYRGGMQAWESVGLTTVKAGTGAD